MTTHSTPDTPGLATRQAAADILDAVLRRKRPLDEQLEAGGLNTLDERDRALARNIVSTALRRLGTLRHVLAEQLKRGLPREAPRVESALLVGATQILFLGVPDHAAVDLSVRLAQADRYASRYAALINAVLRRLARDGAKRLATLDATMLDTPEWLMRRWITQYGEERARAIAHANGREPALDLTVKGDAPSWAARLGAMALPTGSVRLVAHGPVTQLPGFAEGQWWVQDAAAAIPARLLGDVSGKAVADLCAAPGGKTAQLASAGAKVTAVDRSAPRLARLSQNLERLNLKADIVTADAAAWDAGPFDAVLIDAPCSATGTIRRHPDIPWLKGETDLAKLTALQARLLDNAARLVRPGGPLVYCVCSLEAEEGPDAIAALLARGSAWRRDAIEPGEVGGLSELITPEGELRTLPCHLANVDPGLSGLDGFYAARLIRS